MRAVVIRMVIPTIGLLPSGSDQIDAASHVSRDDPTPPDVSDCKIPPRNRKVVGSTPTSGSPKTEGQSQFGSLGLTNLNSGVPVGGPHHRATSGASSIASGSPTRLVAASTLTVCMPPGTPSATRD
jgi:hypothetical protein